MSRTSVTERLKAVQRRLGVKVDGLLGPDTLTKIEELLPAPDAGATPSPAFSLEVSRKSLNALVGFEISSEAFYRSKLSHPTWPGAESGVTIGIGYDLGHNTKTQIRDDWTGRIPDADLEQLVTTSGKKGAAGKTALSASIKKITVPLEAAKQVFFTATLPRYGMTTRRAYPGVQSLPADAQGGLLSLIFNRGAGMSGPRRAEMAAIRPLVKRGDLPGIASQIRAMKRLWDIQKLAGLHKRRDAEARLVANARETYDPEELLRV